jgi:hypothetical protein
MTDKPIATQPLRPPTEQQNSTVQVSIGQEKVDLLPRERDESAASQVAPPRKIMKQAAIDVDRGLKDTDRGVEIGKTYAKQKH